ncbi:hypothetical protein CVT25_001324 [Psilocybe cyanescens]|uniref:Uncharacterized protein n=1 Tax=Psilocybe cyanescens TaxID=93625 RepID=A0A409XES8_PSICY|nr:hypothetical protein CVT25_001324 [Psilocybe cyanescens]
MSNYYPSQAEYSTTQAMMSSQPTVGYGQYEIAGTYAQPGSILTTNAITIGPTVKMQPPSLYPFPSNPPMLLIPTTLAYPSEHVSAAFSV